MPDALQGTGLVPAHNLNQHILNKNRSLMTTVIPNPTIAKTVCGINIIY